MKVGKIHTGSMLERIANKFEIDKEELALSAISTYVHYTNEKQIPRKRAELQTMGYLITKYENENKRKQERKTESYKWNRSY